MRISRWDKALWNRAILMTNISAIRLSTLAMLGPLQGRLYRLARPSKTFLQTPSQETAYRKKLLAVLVAGLMGASAFAQAPAAAPAPAPAAPAPMAAPAPAAAPVAAAPAPVAKTKAKATATSKKKTTKKVAKKKVTRKAA